MIVEACVDSVAAAMVAEEAGADRIELNCALELDGLTPPAGLVERVCTHVNIPVICMVRCRAGNFRYSRDELQTMRNEVATLRALGADGIAFGALTDSGGIDVHQCREMRETTAGLQLVFHKAFDETSRWREAIDQLVDLGFERIMTSGQASTAIAGAEVIREMLSYSNQRIELLPAGGIRAENAVAVTQQTGCDQIHGSFRSALGPFDPEVSARFRQQLMETRRKLDEHN